MFKNILLLTLGLPLLLLAACATPRPPQWTPVTPTDLNHPLSMKECLTLARKSDLHVTEWKARLESAHAELITARTLPNPTFQPTWENIGLHDAAGASLLESTYGVSYPIFFWWTKGKEVAVARKKLRAEEESVRNDRRGLAREIGTTYIGLLGAARKIRSTEALRKGAQESLRLAEESFKVGLVSGHDVALAQTEVRQSEAELFDARHEEEAQSLAFAFALGADRPALVRIQDEEPRFTKLLPQDAATTATLPPESLLAQALKADPLYAKAQASREAAEAGLQLQYRRRVPLSEASASAGSKSVPEGTGGIFSLDIPIPLFDRNQGGVKKAKAELLAARTEEEKARREVAARLSEAWNAYSVAKQRYEGFAQQIEKSRARLASESNDLFAAGQISYTDLILARREWRQAELAAVSSWQESMADAWKILCELGANDS